jgi:hypothetical protein
MGGYRGCSPHGPKQGRASLHPAPLGRSWDLWRVNFLARFFAQGSECRATRLALHIWFAKPRLLMTQIVKKFDRLGLYWLLFGF